MNKNNDVMTEQTTKLNEDLLDQFSEKLEETINVVCEKNQETDPRLELLVTLGLFASQVSIDCGFTKDDFFDLMEDLYKDFEFEGEIKISNKKIMN